MSPIYNDNNIDSRMSIKNNYLDMRINYIVNNCWVTGNLRIFPVGWITWLFTMTEYLDYWVVFDMENRLYNE